MPYYNRIRQLEINKDFIIELDKLNKNNNFSILCRYLYILLQSNKVLDILNILKFINNKNNKYMIKLFDTLNKIDIMYDENNIYYMETICNLIYDFFNLIIKKNKNLIILLNEIIYYINKLKSNNNLLKYKLLIYFLKKCIYFINNNDNLTKIYLEMDEFMAGVIKLINKNIIQ